MQKRILTDTSYETISQQIYRVAITANMTGSVTNSVQVRKMQLTGLSDALRGRTVSVAESGRKELVTRRDYAFGGQPTFWYSTEYDLLGRPTNATDSVSLVREWLYNRRSELAAANIGTNCYGYVYDTIGNRLWSAENSTTNFYTANALNQYMSVAAGTNLSGFMIG